MDLLQGTKKIFHNVSYWITSQDDRMNTFFHKNQNLYLQPGNLILFDQTWPRLSISFEEGFVRYAKNEFFCFVSKLIKNDLVKHHYLIFSLPISFFLMLT